MKYLDAEGREVAEKDAVMVLVSEYDKDGKLIAEHFGSVGGEKQLDSDAKAE